MRERGGGKSKVELTRRSLGKHILGFQAEHYNTYRKRKPSSFLLTYEEMSKDTQNLLK